MRARHDIFRRREEEMMQLGSGLGTLVRTGMIALGIAGCSILAITAEKETPQQVLSQAAQAHGLGAGKGKITDWVGKGKILMTGRKDGPFDFTLTVKGNAMVNRIIFLAGGSKVTYGSDGKKNWQASGPFSGAAAGSAEYFIESQTARSFASLFTNSANGYVLKDLGKDKGDTSSPGSSSQVIEADNGVGQTTRYYIDDATSLITRIEFDTGGYYKMLFGDQKFPLYAGYIFSDYRDVDGVMTPFKIEVYQGLIKIEEMNFTTVKYNTGIDDGEFAQ
jgi:hypothetical protein